MTTAARLSPSGCGIGLKLSISLQKPLKLVQPTPLLGRSSADASSAVYTPEDDDEGTCLRASVTYTDNIPGDAVPVDDNNDDADTDTPENMDGITVRQMSDRPVQESNPANSAPKFPDQDPNTPGDQSDSTTRKVEENTDAGKPIGAPVDAGDGDLLLYTLGGADMASFGIDENNGQIKTKAEAGLRDEERVHGDVDGDGPVRCY